MPKTIEIMDVWGDSVEKILASTQSLRPQGKASLFYCGSLFNRLEHEIEQGYFVGGKNTFVSSVDTESAANLMIALCAMLALTCEQDKMKDGRYMLTIKEESES